MLERLEDADFVVVGSGVAGLRAAIELAEAWKRVLLLTKDAPSDSNSDWAQGGVAVALSEEDEVGIHFDDTLRAGAGLSEEAAARILVENGPRHIVELIEWGAEFDRNGIALDFTQEAAHSKRRVIHAEGDATGREMVRALLTKASTHPNITMVPRSTARDLLVAAGSCHGVSFLDETSGSTRYVQARAVLLATGGAGRVFRDNTNPPQATGDGLAMAYIAGAELMDMEFVQFHPTTLAIPGAPAWLLTEALRGEGGILRDRDGRRYMPEHHPDAELAPRDVVSRCTALELRLSAHDHVLLDLTHRDATFLRQRFPGIVTLCRRYGLDLTRDPIPVRPAAHYVMGGVRTDLWGRTTIGGLYAAGEVACTGVHGGNRLASNSLLEGLVFGVRAAEAMLRDRGSASPCSLGPPTEPVFSAEVAESVSREVEELASAHLGVLRDGRGLEQAIETLARLGGRRGGESGGRSGIEARNRWIVATAIAEAAAWRKESRGAHYRLDHPQANDIRYKVHSVQRWQSAVRGVPVGAAFSPDGRIPFSG